jgi:ribosomal protein S9
MPKNEAAIALGSKGGQAGTKAQTEARRANIARANAARTIQDQWTDDPALTRQQRYLLRKKARQIK